MSKVRCAVIGSGNIGTDIIYKLKRSPILEPLWLIGIDPESEGLARASDMGMKTTSEGLDSCLNEMKGDDVRIVFDATSAAVHAENSRKVNEIGMMMIDLTPAAIGPFCVPSVNLEEHAGQSTMNVNMVTCGGQATIPMVAAISRVQPLEYAEIIATAASKSAGPGTRNNIDEFTRTTARAVAAVGNSPDSKAIVVLNPADPPIIMRDTVLCLTKEAPKEAEIIASVKEMVKSVQEYVPGYSLKNGPLFDGNKVSIFLEVEGLGDFLPKYAGNLDIMTAAAVKSAEMFAARMSEDQSQSTQCTA